MNLDICLAYGNCLSVKQEHLYDRKRNMNTLKDPSLIEKEMLPLTMAEINYLCIDKCTMTTKSEEYINTKTFNQNYKVK